MERQADILNRYENGDIGRNPNVKQLCDDYDVHKSTLERDLREIRMFMRSNMYDGSKPAMYPSKSRQTGRKGAVANEGNDWKATINARPTK